jgi:hypothetical protein
MTQTATTTAARGKPPQAGDPLRRRIGGALGRCVSESGFILNLIATSGGTRTLNEERTKVRKAVRWTKRMAEVTQEPRLSMLRRNT